MNIIINSNAICKPICRSHKRHSKQNLQIRLLLLATLNFLTVFLTIWTVFGLVSCDNSNQENTVQPTTTADTIIKTTTNPEINQDTLNYVKVDLSNYENTTAILWATGVFPSSEWLENANKDDWFGLFQSDEGFYIEETEIIVEKAHYPLGDNDNEKSGLSVQTLNKDESIFLISGLDFLKNHKINSIETDDFILQPRKDDFTGMPKIFPGDTLKFNYLGIDYKIYATGSKKIKDEYQYLVWDYKLYLTADKNGHVFNELVTQEINKAGPDEITTLIFAGDIDGDGFLDLLVDQGLKRTLYLSIIADKGQLLKIAGIYMHESC